MPAPPEKGMAGENSLVARLFNRVRPDIMSEVGKKMKIGKIVLIILFVSLVGIAPALAQVDEAFIKEYKIGAKDVLEITVVELPELNQTVRVSEDGSITLPLIGRVAIDGLTKEEVEKRLAALLLEQNYVKNARVTVFIKEYQSKRVALIGAVTKPGMYELVGRMTLLQLISQAAGLTENASSSMFVLREGKDGNQARIVIDLDDLINNGNQTLNIPLQAGDIVNIPVEQFINVYVFGAVRNPGVIQAKMSKNITILQAIAQAGGLIEGASKSGVTVTRKDKKTGDEIKIKVNLNDVLKGKEPAMDLLEGDVVYVPESIF
jgi:polysaccharide export outer membrane protein